jgi:hypothetical protein
MGQRERGERRRGKWAGEKRVSAHWPVFFFFSFSFLFFFLFALRKFK